MAASSIDSKFPHFLVSMGELDDLAKSRDVDLRGQVAGIKGFQINAAVVDNADQVHMCSVPYQVNLIDPGSGIGDLLTNAVDGKELANALIQGTDRAQRIVKWSILGPLWALIDSTAKVYGALVDKLINGVRGANVELGSIAHSEFWFNLLNFFLMGALRKHKRITGYVNDFRYPVGLPTAAEAGGAWLRGALDECTFEAYVKANDVRFAPFKQIVSAGKFTFSPLELMTLEKRGKLKRGDIFQRLRELGSLEYTDVDELNALFDQIPGPADLIRMMLRDVENPEVVGPFGLDDGFGDNFQGTLKDWAAKQGLSDQVMKYEWRAHWSIPSPTQLYEMLHRLRHDPQFGGPGQVLKDVKTALKQQDILPFWIDKLIAVSYHPLTRTDLNRAYERGWITDDDYIQGMYANGYSDDDAPKLLKFAQQERAYTLRHLPEIKLFADGDLDQSQLVAELKRQGWDESVIPDALDEGIAQKLIRRQRLALEAITRQYRACRISREEAEKDAQEIGIPTSLLDYHLGIADLNSLCSTRKEWASQLCTALTENLITADDYVARMRELKYDDKAITIQLSLCQNRIAARKAKEAMKQQKEQEKEAAAADRAARRAEREAEQQAKRLAGQAAAQERRRQARNAQLAHAAEALGAKLADVDGPPAELVATLFRSLQLEHGLSQDEAARVLATAAAGAKGKTTAEFIQWVNSDAVAMLSTPWTLFPVG